jgi:hypothetical protein
VITRKWLSAWGSGWAVPGRGGRGRGAALAGGFFFEKKSNSPIEDAVGGGAGLWGLWGAKL